MQNPYWLIREVGISHGLGTVSFDDAVTAEKAIEVWRENNVDGAELFDLFSIEVEAVVATLTYDENNMPQMHILS